MELKERILKSSQEQFFKYGIRNVTMKDIADSLGVSKKTIYTEFENKDAIVTEITESYLCDHAKNCMDILATAENAIDELIKVTAYVQKTINKVNASMLNDLKKFHPKGWNAMEEHKFGHIESLISRNIERGKKEGLYRKEMNDKIITRLKTVCMDIISEEKFFPESEFNYADLHLELMIHYLYGICTIEGHAIIDKQINHLKEK